MLFNTLHHFPHTRKSAIPTDFATSSSIFTLEVPPFDSHIDPAFPSTETERAPTDETILFDKIISSLETFPDLFPLLSLSASSIHPQFAADLCAFRNASLSKPFSCELRQHS
jgi:hypothetical protein